MTQSYDRASGRSKPIVPGLPEKYAAQLSETVDVWNATVYRNGLRNKYYDAKNTIKDLGISIPPPLLGKISTVVGWPAKAVSSLAVRSRFDGFSFDGSDSGLGTILDENDFYTTYRQAVTSELTNSCVFCTVTRGGIGEPDVVLSMYSAINSAAVWDYRRKRIRCGLVVSDFSKTGQPTGYNLFSDDAVVSIRKNDSTWSYSIMPHPMGRPLMEPMVYNPTLDRPFGRSRISRAVMSITDEAVRETLRTSIASEFFTAPQRYIMGADPDLFDSMPKWEAYIGSFLALTRDDNGDVPNVGQFTQGSMQPHTEYMRSLASQFAGETNVPISSLGVVSDNPSSAEAIYAAKEDLIIEAESLNELNGRSLRNIGLMALAIKGNKSLSELTDGERSIQPKFMNPARPSLVSQSDAMVKQASVVPEITRTRVYWEELGYTHEQVDALLRAVQQSTASQTVKEMLDKAKQEQSDVGAT